MTIRLPASILFCLLTLIFGSAGSALANNPPVATLFSDEARLPGHVLPALADAIPVPADARHDDSGLSLTLILRRADQGGFERYLTRVYAPGSEIYRDFLSPVEVSDRYGPSRETYAMVRAFFQQKGFHVSADSTNRMTLTVAGTLAQVEEVLDVRIHEYELDRRRFRANDREPRLPSEIAGHVAAVIGLSDLAVPQPVVEHFPNNPGGRAAWYALCANSAINGGLSGAVGGAEATFTLMGAIAFAEVIAVLNILNSLINIASASDLSSSGTGQQYAKCVNLYNKRYGYGLIGHKDPPPPAWQGSDGTGQTVGLVAFDVFDPQDIENYVNFMGPSSGPASNVSRVVVNGGASPGANQDEVLLDIAAILTGAPGAKVIVFDTPFTGAGSFQQVFNEMINAGVSIISNSWAYCEDQTTLADVQSIDAILQTAAASGISVFTGSGDKGSTCLNGSPDTAHVPATSPYITAVGGTSLVLEPGFTYGSETWWDGSADTPPTGQGGFGLSRFFGRPAYQDGINPSAMRSIPDLSVNADPKFGIMICQESAGGCPSGLLYGGTSLSAPTMAAFTAMLNQAQGFDLGFLNPLIYPLAGTDAFRDAASMGSDFAHVGLGSPNLARMHQYLTGQSAPGPVDPVVSMAQLVLQTSYTQPFGASTPVPVFADGTTQAFVTVRLADEFGNPVGGKTVEVIANPAGNVEIQPPTAVTGAEDGVAHFIVTNTSVETVTLSVFDQSDGITLNDTLSVDFIVPPPAAGSIVASPDNVFNNGTDTTTITVSLEDAQGLPVPGKEIALFQGNGRSVISGPSPSVTDANGQIEFTAINQFIETVTYTAVDVSDDNLPVPGSATVQFGGLFELSCVGDPPSAATGFSLTSFINGFASRDLFFGNVNWGCTGASNPTFSPSGTVFATNFSNGDLFGIGPNGGAVTDGNRLSNLNPTLGQPVLGKDGRLYATHGATTGNFTTGDIVEIDPETGAQIRVVAANLTCPNGLAVDPISGDLFFDGACTGAGSDDPNLYRIRDPGSANAVVEVYADLTQTPNGDTPNGAISFAPDGSIYVVTDYFLNPFAPVLRVDGTNVVDATVPPTPPTVTEVPGVTSSFWVTVGAANPDGSAKSLIVLDVDGTAPDGLQLVDITTNPPTVTYLTDGGIGSGVIGPDGCLYAAATDTIYRLAPESGICQFAATNPAPVLDLIPTTQPTDPQQGDTVSLIARLRNVASPGGTPIRFEVDGANPGYRMVRTDSAGNATFEYLGEVEGSDRIVATTDADGGPLKSNRAQVDWLAGPHTSLLNLNASPLNGSVGQMSTLVANLSDISVFPFAPAPGETVNFTLNGDSCTGVTDQNGSASCDITPQVAGRYTLIATFDGSVDLLPSSDQLGFDVLAAVQTSNQPPVADAGADQTIRQGNPVTLDGSASSDPDNGPSALSFAWSQSGGPNVNLTDPGSATPGFTAVDAGTYLFNLVVNDGADDSPVDGTSVLVPLLGDVDLDGDVDRDDLTLVLAARNQPADGPNDLRDIDANGVINVLDGRRLALLCTRPRCAVQ